MEVRAAAATAVTDMAALIATLGLMWIVLFATWLSGGALLEYGVFPRTIVGLRGIVFAPFLHVSIAHLLANSVPFMILGWLVTLDGRRNFLVVTAWSMLGSGLSAWLFGATGSVHIGASGVIFGYLGYLLLSGWYNRSVWSALIAAGVAITWGGIVFGILPGHAGISWQAHLGGFVGGWLAARSYRVAS
jgi:membrane associated rhomboid family serine protease